MAKQDVVFRGTRDGLYLILNDEQNFEVLKEKLKEHLRKGELFFQGADVVVDTGNKNLTLDQILDLQDLLAHPSGLRLKKIVHNERPTARKGVRPVANRERVRRDMAEPVERYRSPEAQGNTLLHKGTLRSGRRISHDGNVVIVGDVNPGAEIVATGDIIIMGALRGLAHAGARGDTDVVVVAFKLEPTQLRIADVIGRPPEGDPELGAEPEVARLRDGMIVVESLEGTRWEGEH
jgi:septum site-determining protein MinC